MNEERIIPHSNEAEQNVLGAVFIEPNTIRTIIDKLEVNDFYTRRHRLIYGAIIDLFQEKVDIDYTTLISRLETKDLLLDAGGSDYILNLADTTPSIVNLEHYINIVKDKAIVRNMIEVAKEIADQGYKTTDMLEFIDDAEKRIFDVAKSRRTSDFITMAQATQEVIKKTEEAKNQQGQIIGLDTGFTELNNYVFGLQPSELYIIAARPSMGKSAFALNIATNIAKLKSKPYVAFFSLEMGVDQLVGRILSSEANVVSSHIRTGELTPIEWQQISVASDKLSRLNILFDDSGTVKVTDMRQKCRKLAQENKLDLVVIDYLQLLSGSKNQTNRVQEVSEISRVLKEMARELKIPVIALSQLSRSVEQRQEKIPILADLRESGSIEQDADVILFLYREDYYRSDKKENTDEVDIIVAKNRSGAVNTKGFKLIFKKQYSRFRNKTYSTDAYADDMEDLD
ncbi:replicative DNA helicase [Liberiplasma polymorphum]|uniref:replicative DNA helicase n=1 Tax=Liberiplasma polymorphum TaxID=3374570 RepID=UPI003775495C